MTNRSDPSKNAPLFHVIREEQPGAFIYTFVVPTDNACDLDVALEGPRLTVTVTRDVSCVKPIPGGTSCSRSVSAQSRSTTLRGVLLDAVFAFFTPGLLVVTCPRVTA